jgi:hypothetical protein
VESEDSAAASIGIVAVGEPGLGAGGLVDERERADRGLHPVRETLDVLAGLTLHLDEGCALGFRLDDSGWLSVQEQQVVNPPVRLLKGELADSDPGADPKIQRPLALDYPPGSCKLFVDLDSGPCLAGEVAVLVRPVLELHRSSG